MEVTEFVLSQLPRAPARVLEVGCGDGTLTRAIAAAGHDALGIDPAAPDAPLFRRLKLEELDGTGEYDAVVAVRSLHHVTELAAGLARIAELLVSAGTLVVEEFAWDRLDRTTAEWYYRQRRAIAAAAGGSAPPSLDECCREWADEHLGLHGYDALRGELAERFDERRFAWVPYLHRLLDGVVSESLERTLIDRGAIQAVAFRYVGVAR